MGKGREIATRDTQELEMNGELGIGRNALCPCGSGKKYKKCHGTLSEGYSTAGRGADYLAISRDIAYKGKIGQMRKDFCISYIKHKQGVFKGIEKTQVEMAEAKGETITCQKGCHYCCVQYVDAGIQEAEAIVYYLYQNESVLNNFLQAYPAWREKVHNSGDPFKNMVHQWEKTEDNKWRDRKVLQGGLAALYQHTMANILCPFLNNSVCSIYDVRPYTCVGCFATTPAELCQPLNRNKARIYTAAPPDVFDDTSFYYRNLEHPVLAFMPVMVYQILSYGLIGMPDIPGLENLPGEFMNDPEVRQVLQKYS